MTPALFGTALDITMASETLRQCSTPNS
jgi:hypothetical protein